MPAKSVVPVTLVRGKDSKRYARFEFPEECPFTGSLYIPFALAGQAQTWEIQVVAPPNGNR